MLTADFDYHLPPELIAQTPAPERTASRMLVVRRASGEMEHRGILDLPDYLQAGDVLVINDTRVIPARLLGQRADTGGQVEVFLLEPAPGGRWEALYRSSRGARVGLRVTLGGGHIAGVVERVLESGRVVIALQAEGSLDQAIAAHGLTPVPPYIHRDGQDAALEQLDHERYQTVYARELGAVAAPTAGLHFTEPLLNALQGRGVKLARITLHVGPGTFKPVKTEQIEHHVMEAERYVVPPDAAETIRVARAAGRRVVAVGSTSVRTLETAAQATGIVTAGSGRSTLFIYPPFPFRVVDAMLTNFHLPRSTLLMMVSALAGAGRSEGGGTAGRDLILKAYTEAIRVRYRFYSYGDCMLLQ